MLESQAVPHGGQSVRCAECSAVSGYGGESCTEKQRLRLGGAWGKGEWSELWFCSTCWESWGPAPFPTAEVEATLPIAGVVRVVVAADEPAAMAAYAAAGEPDPCGLTVCPFADACAIQLLEMGVEGRSVLELGCGCALPSLAALVAGARWVLATDLSAMHLRLVAAASKLQVVAPQGELATARFDVASADPLPTPLGGLDFVVFSDAVRGPEAHCFGRRAAEALAAGAAVVCADGGWEREAFFVGLLGRAAELGVPLPDDLGLHPLGYPSGYEEWALMEARRGRPEAKAAGAELDPFLMVLRPP